MLLNWMIYFEVRKELMVSLLLKQRINKISEKYLNKLLMNLTLQTSLRWYIKAKHSLGVIVIERLKVKMKA